MRSNLTSHVNVTKTPQKHILWTFCSVLMIIKSDLKIYLIISEPHYVKFFFVNLLHRPGVWHFDIWQIISLMSDLMSDLMSCQTSCQISCQTSFQTSCRSKFSFFSKFSNFSNFCFLTYFKHFLRVSWVFKGSKIHFNDQITLLKWA